MYEEDIEQMKVRIGEAKREREESQRRMRQIDEIIEGGKYQNPKPSAKVGRPTSEHVIYQCVSIAEKFLPISFRQCVQDSKNPAQLSDFRLLVSAISDSCRSIIADHFHFGIPRASWHDDYHRWSKRR